MRAQWSAIISCPDFLFKYDIVIVYICIMFIVYTCTIVICIKLTYLLTY